MNLHFENVNLQSTSGPNHFASKLIGEFKKIGVKTDHTLVPDVRLCFIETPRVFTDNVPLFQRLDGIYFNTAQDYGKLNSNIQRTYGVADGVIFQSHFNKSLVSKYFGGHHNSVVIHNGADIGFINNVTPLEHDSLDKFENVWCCASSWRPHKRLKENIRYFLEHSSEQDCLVVAGSCEEKPFKSERIFYVGNVAVPQLISLYKRSEYFIHLAWLDHCPNVVVDARASGCKIVCSSAGGTQEIAGPNAVVVREEKWDFQPTELYQPPILNFDDKIQNEWDIEYDMRKVAERYKDFLLEE